MCLKRRLKAFSLIALVPLFALPSATALAADALHPAEMNREDIAGAIFDREDTIVSEDGSVLDITSLMSSDGRFASGMYRAGPSREVIDEPYGVDEFMYFLEGGVTLTSSDGHVTTIEAGEAVTIPKEWTGVWETDGYTKIWVIYSEDGSGLQ
ncbi:MAG: cupin domain-containing protein [Halieaceae bacterium]|jgi:uncharacterized cupin superfamily protein|nr:cupin domain-containing protein [Halieaceae bacterium]